MTASAKSASRKLDGLLPAGLEGEILAGPLNTEEGPVGVLIVVGSPAYLERNGRPARPDDLRQHQCLRLRRTGGALAPWSLNDQGRGIEIAVSGPFIANDFPTMLGAAIAGVGLAQVPEPIAAEPLRAGKLIHVLVPFAPTSPGMFLYYPGYRQIMPKLRAFVDHVKSHSRAMRRGGTKGRHDGLAS